MKLTPNNESLIGTIEAQQRTIDALMKRVEDGFSSTGTDLQATAENARLEQLVQKRTRALKQTMVELRQAQSALLQAQKLESIGQLAAGIAHEINTPMQYIRGNAEFLRQAIDQLTTYAAEVQALTDPNPKKRTS